MIKTASPVTLRLPLPPSLNQAYRRRRNGFGLYKTAHVRAWEQEAFFSLAQYRPKDGHFGLRITFFYASMRCDIDNGLKLLLDIMQGRFYHDDNQVIELIVQKRLSKTDPHVLVTAYPLPNPE